MPSLNSYLKQTWFIFSTSLMRRNFSTWQIFPTFVMWRNFPMWQSFPTFIMWRNFPLDNMSWGEFLHMNNFSPQTPSVTSVTNIRYGWHLTFLVIKACGVRTQRPGKQFSFPFDDHCGCSVYIMCPTILVENTVFCEFSSFWHLGHNLNLVPPKIGFSLYAMNPNIGCSRTSK